VRVYDRCRVMSLIASPQSKQIMFRIPQLHTHPHENLSQQFPLCESCLVHPIALQGHIPNRESAKQTLCPHQNMQEACKWREGQTVRGSPAALCTMSAGFMHAHVGASAANTQTGVSKLGSALRYNHGIGSKSIMHNARI